MFDRAVEAQTDEELAARAALALEEIRQGEDGEGQLGHSDEPLGLPDTLVLVIDASGRITRSNVALGPGERAIADAVGVARSATFETVRIGVRPIRVHAVPLAGSGALVVGRSIAALETARAQLATTLLLLLPAALALASLGGYVLARRALGPVDELRRRADEIVDLQDLDRRLAARRSDDELGRLGTTLDRMLERIARSAEQQRRFAADASHELRTPLAAILGDASLTLSRPRIAEEYRSALGRTQDAAGRLASIVDALLTISRADAGALPQGQARADLGEVAALAVERHAERARGLGTTLRLRADPDAIVRADPDALGRVVDNLLDNALRYGSRGGQIRVVASRDGARASLAVEDDGPGFAPDLLPRAFERFRRGAVQDSDGSGLGLAIVEAVAKAYGGSARAENVTGGGARVSLDLPLAAGGRPGGSG